MACYGFFCADCGTMSKDKLIQRLRDAVRLRIQIPESDKYYLMRQTFAQVDLDAYRRNIRSVRNIIGPDVKLMAVVKANAYGHGLVQIAKAAQDAGVDYLDVSLVEEGIVLRQAGIHLPILVLSGLTGPSAEEALKSSLSLTVFTLDQLTEASAAAGRLGVQARVHLKLDTGMNRIGMKSQDELRSLMSAMKSLPGICLEGAYTHFACADSPDTDMTDRQLARFLEMAELLPDGILLHASGSSAALNRPDARLSMVRVGIALYGYSPVPTAVPLQPVLSWVAEITHVKEVSPGETISYGATVTANRHMRVATLALGYGDGYSRLLSNRAQVLINGKRCKVLGRICMDQTMVDVTDAGPVAVGGRATIIGRDGGESISAQELANLSGTIPYETLIAISPRVPRVYLYS